MELSDLTVFYRAAKAQSFLHSGVNLSPSAIGRKISKLESELKVKLFHRHQQGVSLTDDGLKFYDRAKKIIAEIEAGKADFEEEAELTGKLIVYSPYCWSSNLLLQYFKKFLEEHPKLTIEVHGSDTIPLFEATLAQIGIYSFLPGDKEILYESLGRHPLRLYATQSYLDQFGTPETIHDLDQHRLISFSSDFSGYRMFLWHLEHEMKAGSTRPTFYACQDVIPPLLASMGIATLNEAHNVIKKHNLINVLPHIQGPPVDIYFMNHKLHNKTKSVQMFKDFLKKELL